MAVIEWIPLVDTGFYECQNAGDVRVCVHLTRTVNLVNHGHASKPVGPPTLMLWKQHNWLDRIQNVAHHMGISRKSSFCITTDHLCRELSSHCNDVIMGAIASQITSLTMVYSIVYSDADQRKHQSSALLTFVRGIHRGPVNSPHKWPVTRKMLSFDDVIMGADSPRHVGSDVLNIDATTSLKNGICFIWHGDALMRP